MSQADGVSDERLAAAHRALREGGDIQFDMMPIAPKPPPPAWLKAFGEWLEKVLAPVGRFLRWLSSFMPDAPYARIFLWTMIAALALLLVWIVQDRIRNGVWRLPRAENRSVCEQTPLRLQAPTSNDLEQHVLPVLDMLTAETGETLTFYVRRGDIRLCVFRVSSPSNLRPARNAKANG